MNQIIKTVLTFCKYGFSSIAATLIDLATFFVLNLIFENTITDDFAVFGRTFAAGWLIVFLATAGARVISSFINYKINRNIVFKSDAKHSIIKYYILVCVQLCVSATLVYYISRTFGEGSALKTLFKAVVDTVLFFINFGIQKAWVFKK